MTAQEARRIVELRKPEILKNTLENIERSVLQKANGGAAILRYVVHEELSDQIKEYFNKSGYTAFVTMTTDGPILTLKW